MDETAPTKPASDEAPVDPARHRLGRADAAAALFLLSISYLIWARAAPYGRLSASHPYLIGFANFLVFSTFGEAVASRLQRGSWIPDHVAQKAVLWGMIGIWISAVFPFVSGGVAALGAARLWPVMLGAFSASLWINLLTGFGFYMMAAHYWAETIITKGWLPPWRIFADPAFVPWARIVMISLLLFWVPVHTITFMVPDNWRTLFASYLSIALGLILSVAKRATRPGTVPVA